MDRERYAMSGALLFTQFPEITRPVFSDDSSVQESAIS